MTRAIRIPLEGDPEVVDIDLKDTHAIMNAHLGGGWIESVNVNYDVTTYLEVAQVGVALLVDEEGLVKHLPINRVATPFYVSNPRDGVICGPALLVGQCIDDEGGWDWCGLPESITPDKVKAASAWAMTRAGVAWA